MGGAGEILTEINQGNKDKHCMFSFIYGVLALTL